MIATVIEIRRRDPDLITARAHAVLDAVARVHGQWKGRDAVGEAALDLDAALDGYAAAPEENLDQAAENAALAMALLLIAVSVYLGKDTADGMIRDAAEVAR